MLSGLTRLDIWSFIAGSVGRPFTTLADLVHDGFDPAWVPPEPVTPPAAWSLA